MGFNSGFKGLKRIHVLFCSCISVWEKIKRCTVHGTASCEWPSLCSLVAVYSCSLLSLVVDARLNVSRSRVIDEVLNPVHRCVVRRHCSRDGRWKFGY